MGRFLAAAVALTLGVPVDGYAGEVVRALVVAPGDQTAPSLSNGRLAYLDDADGDVDVRVAAADGTFLFDVTAQDGRDQSWPRISGDVVAYREPDAIRVVNLADAGLSFSVLGTGEIAPLALGPVVVAWEQSDGLPGSVGGDVAWRRLADGEDGVTVVQSAAGDQRSVSVAWGWVGWLDLSVPGTPGDGAVPGLAQGAIRLLDTVEGRELTVRVPNRTAGPAIDLLRELSIAAPGAGVAPTVAVIGMIADGAAEDRQVVVLDAAGAELARLATGGEKINPHLVGDWVGFEDLSLVSPQVFLWNWRAPVEPRPDLHAPRLNGATQKLHDLELLSTPAGEKLSAAWAEVQAAGDYDLWGYEASLPLEPDLDPPDEPANCDDADPVLLGELVALRLTAKPKPYAAPITFDAPQNVLVCMDGVDVTAGGAAVGTQLVAGPEDFGRGEVHREARFSVAAGDGAIAAILAGKPGGSLRVRVLRDGELPPPVPPDLATCAADGTCQPPPPGLTKGCTSSGGAGGLALLLIPAAMLALRRRSRAR